MTVEIGDVSDRITKVTQVILIIEAMGDMALMAVAVAAALIVVTRMEEEIGEEISHRQHMISIAETEDMDGTTATVTVVDMNIIITVLQMDTGYEMPGTGLDVKHLVTGILMEETK